MHESRTGSLLLLHNYDLLQNMVYTQFTVCTFDSKNKQFMKRIDFDI